MSEDWRGVLVVGELDGDQLADCTLELLNEARNLTDRLGGRLSCVLVGESAKSAADSAIHHGADTVLVDETPNDGFQAGGLVQPLGRLIEDRRPEIVLVSATDLGRDLGPMLGARLDTGVASECIELDIDVTDRQLKATRHVFGGELQETLVIPKARPQIASLKPGAAREGFPDEMRFGDTEEIDLDLDPVPEIVDEEGPVPPGLEGADTVIVGGRGVREDEWEALEQLAEALSAPLGATLGAVHGGRADEDGLVDKTGATIEPELYLGFGVFGDFEHVIAMRDAEWIASVNRDPDAPIRDTADWHLVADPAQTAREFTQLVENGDA